MDEAVAIGSRHVAVDLRHNVVSTLGGREGGIHAHAETAKTVRVGRRYLDERDINRHRPAFEQRFDLAEVDGRVIGTPVINGLAHIAADKHGVMAEVRFHVRSHIGSAAHGHHVDNFHVVNTRGAPEQSFDKSLRLRAPRLDIYPHSRLDAAHGFVGALHLFCVVNFP